MRCTALAKTKTPPRIPGGSRENAKFIILCLKDTQAVSNTCILRDHIFCNIVKLNRVSPGKAAI